MNSIQLTGAALDTLHSLFWFGPREAGSIPSKSGERELAESGLCIRHDFVKTPGNRDTHLCVLTGKGYEYAFLLFVKNLNS